MARKPRLRMKDVGCVVGVEFDLRFDGEKVIEKEIKSGLLVELTAPCDRGYSYDSKGKKCWGERRAQVYLFEDKHLCGIDANQIVSVGLGISGAETIVQECI